MLLQIMKAKLHGVRVTEANLSYTGSLGVDSDLLRESGILPYEKVQVLNLDRGARLETYVIPEEAGSGKLEVNGAAAHHFKKGETALVIAYAQVTPAEQKEFRPVVLIIDENNKIKQKLIKEDVSL
jgi:aspartate 1-decarboxylase